jgi:AraC-like DNA-binding protein
MVGQSAQHTVKIAFDQISILISVQRDGAPELVVPADLPQSDTVRLSVVNASLYDQLERLQREALPTVDRRSAPLQKWRLKRVVEYVDGHLGRRITLADMAAAAGLTRMHFAAQFRAATGLRPHHYVLQRRVERAQELLRDPRMALVEVALNVGFQTQAHFTTVFKRFAGATPHRWRRLAPERPAAEPGVERAIAVDPGIEQGGTMA